ncbi:MAG: T9SS type A sorting domain-containing protein [Bacteroidetes bacterium]|nr:T9SS type A sorting domain-containing protein [Bacteroidota bacterium]
MWKKITTISGVFRFIMLFYFFFSFISLNNIYADDTPETAISLGANSSNTGSLGDIDIVDWWVVTIPVDGTLFIETNSDASLEIDLYIYDQDGTHQIAIYDISTGTRETTHKSNAAAGTYYIKAYRYSGSGSYSINCTFTEASFTNDLEINDTPEQAIIIEPNTMVNGHFGFYYNNYLDREDWYKITLINDGSLIFRTTSDESGDIDLYIYDVDGTHQIAIYDTSTGINESTHKNNLKAGTYFLKLWQYSGYGSYTLQCIFEPIDKINDQENNDTPENALALSPNTTITGHLGYYYNNETDTFDWYKIVTPSDGKLVITTNSSSTLDIDLYMYDQNGEHQIAGYDISTGQIEATHRNNLMAGTYYVKLYSYSGYGSYELICNYTANEILNDLEPNNEFAAAETMNLEEFSYGHIGYYFEGSTDIDDYYIFTISTALDSLFIRMSCDSTADPDIYLYDASQNGYGSSTATGTGIPELIIKSNVQQGTYYFKVHNYSGYGGYSFKASSTRTGVVSVEAADNQNVLPVEYNLYQNYPNPFNPETSIQFDIPESGFVTLKIYDILGKEIKTLVNNNLNPGIHNVKFDGTGISSGMYIYKLTASNFTSIKKMLLIK